MTRPSSTMTSKKFSGHQFHPEESPIPLFLTRIVEFPSVKAEMTKTWRVEASLHSHTAREGRELPKVTFGNLVLEFASISFIPC